MNIEQRDASSTISFFSDIALENNRKQAQRTVIRFGLIAVAVTIGSIVLHFKGIGAGYLDVAAVAYCAARSAMIGYGVAKMHKRYVAGLFGSEPHEAEIIAAAIAEYQEKAGIPGPASAAAKTERLTRMAEAYPEAVRIVSRHKKRESAMRIGFLVFLTVAFAVRLFFY